MHHIPNEEVGHSSYVKGSYRNCEQESLEISST